METSQVRILDYFHSPGTQEVQYIVPIFQRKYEWNTKKWETLWDDIMSYYDDETDDIVEGRHFMGTVVTDCDTSEQGSICRYRVIDGQQRLITVSILLCALRDAYPRLTKKLQPYIENNGKSERDYLKLYLSQQDRQAYHSIVVNIGNMPVRSSSPIVQCYCYFKNRLLTSIKDGSADPDIIFKIIRDVLLVVKIELDSTDDAHRIFESLNYKGAPLTQADLIRNYILMRFKHSTDGGEQEKISKEIWQPIEDMLGNKINDFFFHYIYKETRERVVKSRIYEPIKAKFNNLGIQEVLEQLKLLGRDAGYYYTFLNPERAENEEIRYWLLFLSHMQLQVTYPFLMKVCQLVDEGVISLKEYEKSLKVLCSYLFRRSICKLPSNELNKLLPQLTEKINGLRETEEPASKWLKKKLSALTRLRSWPNDEEFKQAIINGTRHNKHAIVPFFHKIEKDFSRREAANFFLKEFTIEHIMPQSLTPEWIAMLGENADDIHANYLDNLGNITVTGVNSEMGNSPFNVKKKWYNKSNININRDITRYRKWTEREILKRAADLAEIAVKVWDGPIKQSKK